MEEQFDAYTAQLHAKSADAEVIVQLLLLGATGLPKIDLTSQPDAYAVTKLPGWSQPVQTDILNVRAGAGGMGTPHAARTSPCTRCHEALVACMLPQDNPNPRWEDDYFFEASTNPNGSLHAVVEVQVFGEGFTSDTLIGECKEWT